MTNRKSPPRFLGEGFFGVAFPEAFGRHLPNTFVD